MRIGLSLVAFLISYNLYLYKIATEVCDMRIMKLWNYYSIGGLLCVVFFVNPKGDLERTFLLVSKLCILITLLTILLTNHAVIKNPYYPLWMINLGTAFVTFMMIISGGRHGLFKDEY